MLASNLIHAHPKYILIFEAKLWFVYPENYKVFPLRVPMPLRSKQCLSSNQYFCCVSRLHAVCCTCYKNNVQANIFSANGSVLIIIFVYSSIQTAIE